MSGSLRLNGSTSGFSEITAPDVAGDQTFTLPAVGGNLVVYQQGVWTPTIKSADGARTATNYATQVGNWNRIGNAVTAYFCLSLADLSGLLASDTLAIGDFPYTSFNGAGGSYASSATVHANGLSDSEVVFMNMLVGPNTDLTNPIYFHSKVGAGAPYYQLTWAQLGTGSLISQFTYITDDTTFIPINGATIS